jgi:hypothetical protein
MPGSVMITLRADQRAPLMASVQKGSEIWNALYNATRITSKYAPPEVHYLVICDEQGARLLRFCSRKNCPDATVAIERAIEAARATRH